MAVIGITGNIASGKSTFRDILAAELGADIFDADVAAKGFLFDEPAICPAVRDALGDVVFGPDGKPDRDCVRKRIFADAAARERLENILHPLVRAAWTRRARDPIYSTRHYLVDIPLLFETKSDDDLPVVVTVACSPDVQHRRLLARRLDPETARQIIAAQMPQSEKIARARHVVWNDGSLDQLASQARILAKMLTVPAAP